MDAETKSALLQMKEEIIKAVTDSIKESNKALKESLTEVYDLRIKIVDEKAERSLKYNAEHYEQFKAVHKRIDNLESRQAKDEGAEKGSDKAREDELSRKRITISIVAVFLTGLGLLIGWLI